MAYPQSQKQLFRPIGFVLDDKTVADDSETPSILFAPLVIRPEHLSRPEQSRSTVTQTLGGAWMDNFGPGLSTIQISGTTGWRGGFMRDGMREFLYLHDVVYTQWHQRRQQAIANGADPIDVRLIFVDGLDSDVSVVEPKSFRLDRDRNQPLLMKYNIVLTVLSPGVPGDGFPLFKTGISAIDDALASIQDALQEIQDAVNMAQQWIDQYIVAPVSAFMSMTTGIFAQVQQIIGSTMQLTGSIVGSALGIAQGGMNLFRALTGIISLPMDIAAQVMGVAGAYASLYCTLLRMLQNILTIPNFGDLYGASGCSSTSGGNPISPLRGTNPFYTMLPTGAMGTETLFVPTAQAAVTQLARMDPTSKVVTPQFLAARVTEVAASPLRNAA